METAEQGWTQGPHNTPPTTPPTPVAGSEAGYPALHEKKDDLLSDLPPPPRNILLSSTYGEVNDEGTCEPSSGGGRDIESARSAGVDEEDEDKGDEGENKKAKAEADEGVVPDRDGNKNKKPSLSSIKKRGRSTAGERPPSLRRKRHRFSSPLSSDEESESDNG
ncbi:hypothetical protein MMC30_009103, partial [Trapelia coarctata]|nr:hypothetical protein [Trapelia coarctata]